MANSECLYTDCSLRVKAHGYCQTHATRLNTTGHPGGAAATFDALRGLQTQKLSVQPLQDLADSRGGVRNIIRDGLSYDVTEMYESRIRRALARGWVSADQADELAVRALDVLPQDLWDDWFQTTDTIAPPSFSIDDHLALLDDPVALY